MLSQKDIQILVIIKPEKKNKEETSTPARNTNQNNDRNEAMRLHQQY